MKQRILGIILVLGLVAIPSFAQQSWSTATKLSAGFGRRQASAYNTWVAHVQTGTSASGAGSLTLRENGWALASGAAIQPFSAMAPVTIGTGATQETATPTAVSGCVSNNGAPGACTITFSSLSFAHGAGEQVMSGSGGAAEAQVAAQGSGGGLVTLDASWSSPTAISALTPLQNVVFEDDRFGDPLYYNPQPNTAFLAVPATLVSTTIASNLGLAAGVAGSASWGSTVHACIAYVDVMGNEGPCSLDYSFTSVVSQAIGWTAPAASPGAVGYTVYLSVSGGTYALAYGIPLTSSNCILTTLETVTPACKLTNATYGQIGVGGVFTGYPVVTSWLAPQLGVISSTTDYVPNSNAHTAYTYTAGSRVGLSGFVTSMAPYTVGAAAGTTVPSVIGTVSVPPGYMNQVGKTIRVCGTATEASAGSTATVVSIQFWWDAMGSNVTSGIPVLIGGPVATFTLVTSNADVFKFCQDLETTVASASATGGSMFAQNGWLIEAYGTVGAHTYAAPNPDAAAIGSLNLAGPARIEVVYLHTTGTDGAGVLLQNLTVQVLN